MKQRLARVPPIPNFDYWKPLDFHDNTPVNKPINRSNKVRKIPPNIKAFKAQVTFNKEIAKRRDKRGVKY